jgi:hypothetical protein
MLALCWACHRSPVCRQQPAVNHTARVFAFATDLVKAAAKFKMPNGVDVKLRVGMVSSCATSLCGLMPFPVPLHPALLHGCMVPP